MTAGQTLPMPFHLLPPPTKGILLRSSYGQHQGQALTHPFPQYLLSAQYGRYKRGKAAAAPPCQELRAAKKKKSREGGPGVLRRVGCTIKQG